MKKLKVLILIIVILAVALQCTVIAAPYFYNPVKSDCILILGYALKDGYTPDEWLEQRLNKGLELFNDGYANYIIVSGGQGEKDSLPVASAMKTWLVNHGVPDKNVLTEEKAGSTVENFAYSKAITDSYKMNSIIVVTNDFHMFRSMIISEKYFDKYSGASSHLNLSFKKIVSYIKESLGVLRFVTLNE